MKNPLDQLFSLSLGAVVYSKEQIEKVVNELVKKGEISRKESKEVIDSIVEKGEATKKKIDDIIQTRIQQALKGLDLVTMSEYRELQHRVMELEKKLEEKKEEEPIVD